MSQAKGVHSTPPLNTSALTPIAGLDWLDIQPDASPADIFRAIGRLRKEARDEIDRLIRFLDESDNHMELEPSLGWPNRMNQSGDEIEDGTIGETTDCEVNGDEEDSSYPEGGCRGLEHPMEDDEDDTDAEPSLGSTGHGSGGTIDYGFAAIRAAGKLVLDCEGDEHDGREPEHEDYDGKADDEPSLGWTDEEAARGQYAGARGQMFDLEGGAGARLPQDRAERLEQVVTAETGVCRRLIRGLSQSQREAVKERMGDHSGVSLVGGREWGLP